MTQIKNIPNPDVNSTEREDEYGNRSDIERENESNSSDIENIPLPPTEPKPAPVEEPPDEMNQGRIDEKKRAPKEII